MIQTQLKLKLTKTQENTLNEWMWILSGVYNWSIRKIEQDAGDGKYYSKMEFQNLLAGHSRKMGMPSHTMQAMLTQAHTAWDRCFKKIGKKPRFKGLRNKLNSVPFPDPIRPAKKGRISIPGLKAIKYHKQEIPEGKIKCGRIVKRASGWYLCLFIDSERKRIERKCSSEIGIDPGFTHLLSMSDGEKISHPREYEANMARLAQAQRGVNKKLTARIQERIASRRKDRNHKLSRKLVENNTLIAFSGDNHKAIQKMFGKSVMSSGHGQLRSMLSYKSSACDTTYIEPSPRKSTMTCSACLSLTGPSGFAGLSVRQWECSSCGEQHDRDTNAAQNTLIAALGSSVEPMRGAA